MEISGTNFALIIVCVITIGGMIGFIVGYYSH